MLKCALCAALATLGLAACDPDPEFEFDLGDEVRALDPTVCYEPEWHTCSIEDGICTAAGSVPACVDGAPLTCTEPFATCTLAFPGETECPAGWVDACVQYP